MDKPNALIPDRFWAKVDARDRSGCWIWTASTAGNYGKFWFGTTTHGAHRWLYQLMHGDLPRELTLDHLCRVTLCVNPAHLEPVSAAVNALRGDGPPARNARKTHCAHGHEFTAENTVICDGGRRRCRTCKPRTAA